jgi:hypothetical protein
MSPPDALHSHQLPLPFLLVFVSNSSNQSMLVPPLAGILYGHEMVLLLNRRIVGKE